MSAEAPTATPPPPPAARAPVKTKPRPSIFRALGKAEPPARIHVGGEHFDLVEVYKHDSWAATALYAGASRKVIVKFNRRQGVLGVPMTWVGRRLARREAAFMATLADVPCVPRDCGPIIVDGRAIDTAVGHWYIEGRPLRTRDTVGDDFFPRLRATLAEIHRRGIAYIDLHKRENILVADDGSPVLIDFQICLAAPPGARGRVWPTRQAIATLQDMDNYHLLKHMLRLRPDQVPDAERDLDRLRPGFVRFCRAVGNPMRATRRGFLRLIGVRGKKGNAASEVAPEKAFSADEMAKGAA